MLIQPAALSPRRYREDRRVTPAWKLAVVRPFQKIDSCHHLQTKTCNNHDGSDQYREPGGGFGPALTLRREKPALLFHRTGF